MTEETSERYWLEFGYTTWEQSCKDPAYVDGDLRECRRPHSHDGPHASGFGRYQLATW